MMSMMMIKWVLFRAQTRVGRLRVLFRALTRVGRLRSTLGSAGAPSPKAQMGSNHSTDSYLDDAEPLAPRSTLEKFKIEIACEKIRDFFHNIDGNPGQEIAGFDEKGEATLNEFDNQKSGDFGSVMFVCKVDDCTLTIKYQDPLSRL